MLVISCGMHRTHSTWWSNTRKASLTLCDDEFRKVFRIPRDLTLMTLSLHTTPAKERVRVRILTGDDGDLAVRTDEDGVYATAREVSSWVKRAIRKYRGKPLYLEVTY